jgi:DNA polymerase-3 subunit delta
MSVASERALRAAIREKSFERAYYFFGEDDFLKESSARELIAAVVDTSMRDFNLDVLRGGEVSVEALDTALSTPPLLMGSRAVMVRDVHALSKDARHALEAYLRQPAADTVLVLIAPAGERADAVLSANAFALEFAPLTVDRIPRWIVHYASAALGATITSGAAMLLNDAVGTDLAQLAAELDKLASYVAGGTITEETVSAIVGVRHGESLGDLLDAIAERDAARATALIPHILGQPKMNLVTILMALSTQVLAIGWGSVIRKRSTRAGHLEREYYTLLKESRTYPGRAWGEAVAVWTRSARHWSDAAVNEATELLLVADRAAKETRFSSDEQLLTSLVLGLCAAGTRAAA